MRWLESTNGSGLISWKRPLSCTQSKEMEIIQIFVRDVLNQHWKQQQTQKNDTWWWCEHGVKMDDWPWHRNIEIADLPGWQRECKSKLTLHPFRTCHKQGVLRETQVRVSLLCHHSMAQKHSQHSNHFLGSLCATTILKGDPDMSHVHTAIN